MVIIKNLTEKDIGRYVTYRPDFGQYSLGRIKSWNDQFIFVVFKCGFHFEKFNLYTGQATSPENLFFEDKK